MAWMLSMVDGRHASARFAESPPSLQLLGSGGTRTDAQSVNLARRLAVEITDRALKDEMPSPDWDIGILRDTVDLVHKNNGHLVFFDVPESSLFKRLYTTPTRRRDIAVFQAQADHWGAPVLAPPLSYTDDDLPDLWHASADLARRFSMELGRAWVRAAGSIPQIHSEIGECATGEAAVR